MVTLKAKFSLSHYSFNEEINKCVVLITFFRIRMINHVPSVNCGDEIYSRDKRLWVSKM